ncbi:MAG: SusC/RagA family TonB-linked outer membrane protein [Chitinophagaceae bacterium]|nr:SusC/RagA family TonB-linked outer membrane protein [Chitinophagaceae bacterium]
MTPGTNYRLICWLLFTTIAGSAYARKNPTPQNFLSTHFRSEVKIPEEDAYKEPSPAEERITLLKDTAIVKGKVVSADNAALAGVSIVPENGKAYITNDAGEFEIPFVQPFRILVSSVGFRDTSVMITSAATFYTIVLHTDARREQLAEVTVVALGISKKTSAVGYSIAEVRGDAVQTAKEPNFVNALQGKLAGVQINTNTGSMGGATKVVIRGNKSITGNNNALFVIDGVFMGNTTNPTYNQQIGGGGYDYGSPIQDINPDDIEQVSVLKGAAATALYGSRGANGVVLITTKKGSNKKGLGITYNLNVQKDDVYYLPKFQNRYGGGGANTSNVNFVASGFDTLWQSTNPALFKNAPTYNDPVKGGYDLLPQYGVDESWGPELTGLLIRPYYSFDENKGNPYFGVTTPWAPQPNNIKDFYETGTTLTNSISVGGSNDKGSFRLAYSNLNQNFILPNSLLKRNNIGFNGNHRLGKRLNVVASVNYSENFARARPGTGFSGYNPTQLFTMYGQRQLEMDMLAYYQFPDGSQVSWNRTSPTNPTPLFATTPYWHQYKNFTTDNRKRLYGLAGFDFKPVDWINISAKVFLDQYTTLQQERVARDYTTGSYARTTIDHREMNYQLIASVNKDLSSKLSLDASAGGNIMQLNDGITGGSYAGLIVPGLYTLTNNIGRIGYVESMFQKRINSVFGNVTLGYNNTIFLDISGRNDWSSSLPKGNNSYFYPATSLSLIFSEWLKSVNWLSFGKVRASLAQIGSDTDPYRTYVAYNAPVLFGSTGNSYILRNPALGNGALKPEISNEFEAGIELKLFNNRVGIDFTYYNRITKDLILPLSISQTSGYSNFYTNVGKSRNRGVELQLSGSPVRNENFTWNIVVNYAANRSKLLALNIPNNPTIDRYVIGTERRRNTVSTAAVVGQPLFVLTGTDYTYLNGEKVITDAGLYVATPGGKVIGNTQPDFVGGITNSFTYKGFILSGLIDFQKGGNFFSYTNMYGLYSGTLAATVENNVRETGVDVSGVLADGTKKTVHVNAPFHFKNNYGIRISTANLYDASYVYLRELRLGYTLPSKVAQLIHSSNASISLYGRNLWLISSNAPNVDPSNIINSDSNIIGLEGGALPSVRSIGINLNISF